MVDGFLAPETAPTADAGSRSTRVWSYCLAWLATRMRELSLASHLLIWLGVIAMVLARVHPYLELARHTAVHLWCVSLLTVALLVITSRILRSNGGAPRLDYRLQSYGCWAKRIMLATPSVYLTFLIQPWLLLPITWPSSYEADSNLKILSWNVLYENPLADWDEQQRSDDVTAVVHMEHPDVVILLEMNPAMAGYLQQLGSEFQATLWMPSETASGIAILSRVPGTTFRSINLAGAGMPAIEIHVPANGDRSSYSILAVHTRSPISSKRSQLRDTQLLAIADWSKAQKSAHCVIGDLNITPWAPAFQVLLRGGQLKDSRHFRGNLASWPAKLGRYGIPIDHALTSSDIQVIDRRVLPARPGSDHRPILVEIH